MALNQQNKFYGNQALHNMLTNSIIGGHLCHAYLFYGQKSVGKRTIAKNFAMAILCKGEEKPCYLCNSCRKIISGNHPDLYLYDGKEGKNAIHIETIRDIRQDAYIRPNESDYKIYILPNAQDLTISAANGFLKVLEEPPAHAMFILTAVSKQAVPETILSRCIPFEVFPMTHEEETAALQELLPDKSETEIQSAAEISSGILGRAIDFLTDNSYNEMVGLTKSAADAILCKSEYRLLCAVNKANSSRAGMLEFITELSALLRNAVLHKLSVKTSADEQVSKLAYQMTLGKLSALSDVLETARQGIESNVNMGLLVNRLTAAIMQAMV